MGRMKISGPRHVHHIASCYGPVTRSDTMTHRQWLLASNGIVYVEEDGAVDESGLDIAPTIKTREMYLAGIGNEWKLDTAHIHHAGTTDTEIAVSYEISKTNTVPLVPTTYHTFSTAVRGLSRIKPQLQAEGITLLLTSELNPTERFKLNYINLVSPTHLLEENAGI